MRDNKHLIFIIPDLGIGGAQRIIIFLINFLVNRGFKIRIIVFKKPGNIIFNLSSKVKIKTLSLYRPSKNIFEKFFYNFYRIKRIRSEIKKNNNEILISFLTTANILTLISSIGLKKKVIVNERNDPSKQQISIIWKFLRFIVYRFAEKIIVNKPNIKKIFFHKKFFFIPNPIVLNSTKKKIKKEKIILSVARLNYQKNLDFLIYCFSKSLAVKREWKLVIIGIGDEKKKLVQLAKNLNISNLVIFKNTVKKIDTWYKKAEIFILPSRFEGMPNSLIEAMNYKVPVIGTDIPGINFFIKNNYNGLLFKINEKNKLIKYINLLVNDKNLREFLGNNAYKKVNILSNPKIFLDSWLNILNK